MMFHIPEHARRASPAAELRTSYSQYTKPSRPPTIQPARPNPMIAQPPVMNKPQRLPTIQPTNRNRAIMAKPPERSPTIQPIGGSYGQMPAKPMPFSNPWDQRRYSGGGFGGSLADLLANSVTSRRF